MEIRLLEKELTYERQQIAYWEAYCKELDFQLEDQSALIQDQTALDDLVRKHQAHQSPTKQLEERIITLEKTAYNLRQENGRLSVELGQANGKVSSLVNRYQVDSNDEWGDVRKPATLCSPPARNDSVATCPHTPSRCSPQPRRDLSSHAWPSFSTTLSQPGTARIVDTNVTLNINVDDGRTKLTEAEIISIKLLSSVGHFEQIRFMEALGKAAESYENVHLHFSKRSAFLTPPPSPLPTPHRLKPHRVHTMGHN
ncbi:hypothetical protein BJ742DRAFT_766029 [Cladochytrium replicatum]|nr:hypothetical protein BJ742DRAFT_766029 [Cladochytrium replicatum]